MGIIITKKANSTEVNYRVDYKGKGTMFSFAPNMELMTSSSLIKKSLQSLKTQIENKAPH